ncbi:hypothetical protein [Embleya sp. MST-111070]|uniref:hypothetical protein n=1 Tax=Embleya sp. MST-111070 TaxID=3398231 RepID=UPI003F740B77
MEVFVRTADEVRAAAESLRDLPYRAWVRGWDAELAAEAAFVGKASCTWDPRDADRIVDGLDRLRDFYDGAARVGDAVVPGSTPDGAPWPPCPASNRLTLHRPRVRTGPRPTRRREARPG